METMVQEIDWEVMKTEYMPGGCNKNSPSQTLHLDGRTTQQSR